MPKAKKKFLRLKSVPSQLLQTNIRRLDDAWDFFRGRGYGFPRFKNVIKQIRLLKKAKGWYAVVAIESDIKILSLLKILISRSWQQGFWASTQLMLVLVGWERLQKQSRTIKLSSHAAFHRPTC